MGKKKKNRKETAGLPVIGMDMGGTKILAGVISAESKILGTAKRSTKPEVGSEKVVDRMIKTAREVVEEVGLELGEVAALCTGAPGPLDPDQGIVWNAPNLGWDNVPLGKLLSEGLGIPAFIANDVDLGALGEHALGAGMGTQDMVGVFVGTGIGGGLILSGALRQGWRKAAAEVGHMTILAEGPVCGCGSRGCLEALASRTAIERDIWAGVKAGRESIVPQLMESDDRERLTSGVIADAYRQGDALVTEVIGRAQFYLGVGIAAVVNLVDPEMIVVGGGVVEALGESYLAPVRTVAYQYFMNKRGAKDVKIVPARLGDNAGLLGAAVYARQKLAKQ